MKKISISATFALALLLPLLNGCLSQMNESVTDQKAGMNGSFEIVKDGLPVNWLVFTQNTTGAGDFRITVDTGTAAEGKQSLLFTVNSCSEKGGRYSPGIAQEIPVQAGETYHISFSIKNEGTDFRVKMNSVSANAETAGPILRSSEVIDEWLRYEYSYQIPAGMNRLKFEVSVLSKGRFHIDDICVKRG